MAVLVFASMACEILGRPLVLIPVNSKNVLHALERVVSLGSSVSTHCASSQPSASDQDKPLSEPVVQYECIQICDDTQSLANGADLVIINSKPTQMPALTEDGNHAFNS